MQQMVALWQALDTRRRMVVAAATVAMFGAVLMLSGLAGGRPSMALLYAGLEGRGAAEVIAALDARTIPYEVRGDAIYVAAAERDSLRMALAGDGLPATGGAGYELLDKLSGFGTTAQMFDAAYWRAKEGELARTIVASTLIRSARVHIAVPNGQPFRQNRRPTASVAVTTGAGTLPPAHARALKFLVASAVAGMTPEDVSVIDADSGTVIAGDDGTPAQGGEDRATAIKRNVERLLEARVGLGRAVVEVSVETVTEREAITERRFDPQGRVAISTETEERSNSAKDTKPGSVTVASNLPEGAGAGGGDSQSSESETRERTNFEVSETTREVLRNPGAIRRLSVAVLVDGVQIVDAEGAATWQPRPDEEIALLRELVASAVGLDETRGDTLTIRSLPFEAVAEAGTTASGGLFTMPPLDVMQLAQLLVLAVVALVLGLFVLRPILTSARARPPAELPAPAGLPALTGEIDDGEFAPGMAMASGFGDMGGLPAIGTAFPMAEIDSDSGDDPVARLRRLIAERQEETAEILRSWMEPSGEEKA